MSELTVYVIKGRPKGRIRPKKVVLTTGSDPKFILWCADQIFAGGEVLDIDIKEIIDV